jgi:hypothetical protein
MADQQPVGLKPQEKKGFFDKLSLFQKVILFILFIVILVLIVSLFLGGINSFYQFFFYLIVFAIIGLMIYVIIQAVNMMFQPKYYSPREDTFTKIKNMAVDYKPDNLNNLYFVGDVGKKRVLAGKIAGCLVLPYYSGTIERDNEGKVIYTDLKTFDGKQVPKYAGITLVDDGDTFFIAEKGIIFKKYHYLRCHRKLHSTLNGDVEVYDVNPIPYGSFEYPYKQIQENVTQIMIQNQIETILATHEHQHDLISQSTDAGLYSNPLMRFSMKQQAELGVSDQQ